MTRKNEVGNPASERHPASCEVEGDDDDTSALCGACAAYDGMSSSDESFDRVRMREDEDDDDATSALCGGCASYSLLPCEYDTVSSSFDRDGKHPVVRTEQGDASLDRKRTLRKEARSFTEMISKFVYSKKSSQPAIPVPKDMSIVERKLQQAALLGKETSRSRKKMRRTWNKEEQTWYVSSPFFPKPDFSKKKKKQEEGVLKIHEGMTHREIIEIKHQISCRVADKLRVENKRAEFEKRKRRLRKKLNVLDVPRTSFPRPAWTPPRSPFRLIQEKLYTDPWKVVMACIFLHRTTGAQTKKMLWEFFKQFPGPQQLIDAPDEQVETIIKPLGLYNRRISLIQNFSMEYLYTDWTDIVQLYGVGTYAEDAYRIFVEGRWREVIPDDAVLEQYWNWLHVNSEKKC